MEFISYSYDGSLDLNPFLRLTIGSILLTTFPLVEALI
jgi:hypothetical protein